MRNHSQEVAGSEASGGTQPVSTERRWTVDRVRRGVAWRAHHAVQSTRDALLLPLAAGSGWLSSVFYALASGAFNREHRGVAYGRRQFPKLASVSAHHHYQLRRNVHRLEKGLIMRPRRASFGANYIEETVATYAQLLARREIDPTAVDDLELGWAQDVLTLYFDVVAPSGTIARARDRWASLQRDVAQGTRVPYLRDLTGTPPVSYEDLHKLALRRRSVRWYASRSVERDVIDKALEVATLSPSACNRQPFEFRIIDAPELVRRVIAIPLGTAGYGHQVPAVAVIIGKLRAFATERDRHLIYIDGGLAAMAFLLALESLGLSSVCINWADLAPQEQEMSRLLNLEPDERVVMLIGFGYPDPEGMVPYSQKKPLVLFRHFNA